MGQSTTDRIRTILLNSGLESLPESSTESLVPYGMDSLVLAMVVLNLEGEFKTRIPTDQIRMENFTTLSSMEALVKADSA